MQAKMDLLDMAHGIICNGRSYDGSQSDEWEEAKRRWIKAYEVLLTKHITKKQNQKTAIVNEFLTESGR